MGAKSGPCTHCGITGETKGFLWGGALSEAACFGSTPLFLWATFSVPNSFAMCSHGAMHML